MAVLNWIPMHPYWTLILIPVFLFVVQTVYALIDNFVSKLFFTIAFISGGDSRMRKRGEPPVQ